MRLSLSEWLVKALSYLKSGTQPDDTIWLDDGQLNLFSKNVNDKNETSFNFEVDKKFFELAELALCHKDPCRFQLLYSILWRLTHGEDKLLYIDVDNQMQKIRQMCKQVTRDMHKMKAFVRFKRKEIEANEFYVSWYEPDHYIVEKSAYFFKNRFANMQWMIFTPYVSLYWNLKKMLFGKGLDQKPDIEDDYDDLWRTYYASIFNPARVKIAAMKNEMPVRFWKNLPEADIIPHLLADAQKRVEQMQRMRKTSD